MTAATPSPADPDPPRLRDALRRPIGLGAVWAVLPMALVAIGFGLLPLRSWDYWWHLSMGRLVDATGEVVRQAHFLYTMPADAPSFVQPWLSQWALFRLHEAAGLHGVLLLRNALATGAFGVLTWWAARRSGSFATGAWASLMGAAFGFLCITARAHLLAWPLFLVGLAVGYGVRGGRLTRPWLLVFPGLTLAWVNLHGTFFIPALLCLAFGAAEAAESLLVRLGVRRERAARHASWTDAAAWAASAAASLGASLLNPRGAEVYLYLADLPTNPEVRTTLAEWLPTTPWHPVGYGLLFWLLVPAALALMLRSWRRVDLADLFILVGFSLLALRYSRALLWVGLILPVVVSPYLRCLAGRFAGSSAGSSAGKSSAAAAVSPAAELVHVAMIAALLSLALAVQPWGQDHGIAAALQLTPTRQAPPYRGLVEAEAPVDALPRLRAHLGASAGRGESTRSRLYHDHRIPGFLVYHLQGATPEQMLWVDNRVELAPPRLWRLHEEINAGRGWEQAFEAHRIEAVLASRRTQGPLIEAMRGADGWQLTYEGSHEALFTRIAGALDAP